MYRIRPFIGIGLVVAASSTTAQPVADSTQASAAKAGVLRYESAFADYRPYGDAEVGDWRALNDQVRVAATRHATPVTSESPAKPASPGAPAMPMHPMSHGGKQ